VAVTNLNNRLSIHPQFSNHASSALSGFKDALIQIIDPHTGTSTNGFDVWTNATGSTPEVLWEGNGSLAVFRQTLNAFMPVGAVTQIRSVRFAVPKDGPDFRISKGMIIKVLSCPDDPEATTYQYTVTSGINGSKAFDRTIEAEADMGVVLEDQ
jgi:hypothetical protein